MDFTPIIRSLEETARLLETLHKAALNAHERVEVARHIAAVDHLLEVYRHAQKVGFIEWR